MSCFVTGHFLETIEESSDSDIDSDGFDTASEGDEVPEFTQGLLDQRVREGELVQFVCVASGHPKPKVNWFWNRNAIGSHEDFSITVEGDRHTLQIGCAYPEDTGIYTAQASTESWFTLSQARLTVEEVFTDDDDKLYSLCGSSSNVLEEEELNEEDASCGVERETLLLTRSEGEIIQGQQSQKIAKMLRKRIKIKPGDTALLECSLDPSKSDVKVKWLKDDEEISPQSSQRYKVRHDDSGVHSLEISDIISDDEGEYSCVAATQDSTISSTAQLIMKERKPKPWDPVPARFLNRIEDLTVTEGEEALFRCQIIGHPIPEVTWYQDDEVLCPCQDVKMTFDGRTTFMIIAAAYPEDSGQYTCQIYNGLGGRLTCSAYLKVKKIKSRKLVPKPPEFTEVFHDRTVCEGTEVKFECRIRGNPKPKVAWLFNNKELKQSPDFLFFRKHNLYVLHIVEAFPEDEGEYTCRAFNSVGETQWSAELFVEEQESTIPSPVIGTHTASFFRPSFLSHTKNCKVIEGGPGTFNCKVTGSPEPEVVWLFNQVEIGEGDHYILEHGEDGSCMLIIPRVTPKDVGEYTCVARSSLGVAQSTASLAVTERTSDDDQEQDSGYRGQERRLSDDFRCSSSGSADIPCRPVGKPIVAKIAGESILLTWETIPNNDLDSSLMYIIEGKDASEEDWVLIATDVTETSYWVSSVNPEGGYVFRVRAEGENGISEPSEESDVVCLMDLLSKNKSASPSKCCLKKQNSIAIAKDIKPFFMESLEDVYVLEHATGILSCKVLSEPPPIVKWYRDEDIIVNSERMQGSYKEDGTCLLEIKDVTYQDIGEYECVAENKIGKASCRLYLDVAEPPGIIKGFPDTNAPAGEQLRLDVRVAGIPEPDVIWYKDERPLSPTSKFTFLFEGEDMCSLKIDQAVPDDEGLYKMTAINMAGEVSHSATVTVPDPMKFFFSDSRIKIKKDVTVEDDYEVLGELGKGAYGVVKKCIHRQTRKECAVKIIRVKNGMWDDLRREVLVMGMLDHKHLINIYDAYETKQDVIMVMELVSGGELFERIVSQDHITESETVFFIKQVIEGVHHMHQKNIVHLDLKPENILLVSPDTDDLKVIDFGLARVVSPDRDVICKFGTPEFVAPEVVCKQPVTTASDVWSIGVMAYILLSGMSPFLGDDDKQTLMKVKKGYWDFDDEVWDSISEEAKEFLRAILVLNPKKRLTLDQCLQHSWLKFDERHDQGVAKLSTQRLKTFNSRRKWQKALTAVKSAMRLRRLSSIAASDINAFRQRHLQAKTKSQDAGSPGDDDKPPQVDGEGRDDTQGETGMGNEFIACTDDDEDDAGIQPLPCIVDESVGTSDDESHACLVVPPLEAQSIMGHPLHDTSTLNVTNVGLLSTTKAGPPVFSVHLQEAIITGGNDLKLSCQVKGHPLATLAWFRNDKKLVDGKRIQLTSDKTGRGSLEVTRIEEEEAGMYKCVATNERGSVTSCAKVSVVERPDAPSRPKISLVAATEVVVTWKLPVNRVNVTGFRLQSKKEDDKQWGTVDDKIQQCFKHISPLLPSTEYRFRVTCCTDHGTGPYSRSSVPATTLPIGSQPLSIEAISKFQTLSRSCSLDQDRKSSSREIILDNFPDGDIEEAIDLTLKDSLPQKAYDFNIEIGRGRYAVVRKCYKYSTGKEHVAKIMLSAEPLKEQNLLEYEILKELNHPNILQLRDIFLTKRFYVLVTERYYGGGVLSHLIHKDRYTEEQIVRLVRQLLSMLSYLHKKQIVHLDLRHDNIILESRRRDAIRVIDFGSAKRMEKEDGMKMEGLDPMPEFMAPEIAFDGLIEYETDLWALGVMIFVWLSGTSPFLGRNREKTMYNITRMKFNRKHLFKNCTPEAKQFVWAILQKEAIDRPSVEECLASPWVSDAPDMKSKRENTVFSSRKLRTQRTEYKLRLLAQQTRQDMSPRRYSSTIELKSPGPPVSPKQRNGVLNSLVRPKVQV